MIVRNAEEGWWRSCISSFITSITGTHYYTTIIARFVGSSFGYFAMQNKWGIGGATDGIIK